MTFRLLSDLVFQYSETFTKLRIVKKLASCELTCEFIDANQTISMDS